jgi:hypothetical protein
MGRACGMCGKKRNTWTVLVEKHERDHLEDLDVDGRIIIIIISGL